MDDHFSGGDAFTQMAQAKLRDSSSNALPVPPGFHHQQGACRKCGFAGHLPYQCRNFIQVKPNQEAMLDISSTSSSDEYETPLTEKKDKKKHKKQKKKLKKLKKELKRLEKMEKPKKKKRKRSSSSSASSDSNSDSSRRLKKNKTKRKRSS